MSYNKGEAIREKIAAEKLLASNDYIGARDRLRKAQQLFPALENIVPMLTVCNILSATINIIPGYEIDHYWVLHLMPSSSISDISCQYQKLVSLLQPIKNKFPGTEQALKLLQDAFSVLSDKKKRFAFDTKRGISWSDYESLSVLDSLCKNPTLDGNNNTDNLCGNVGLPKSSSSSSDVISEGNRNQYMDLRVEDTSSATELDSLKTNECTSNDVHGKLEQDFYDFESHRNAEHFEAGKICAIHHSYDLRTFRYALVNSKSESTCKVTWLRPIPVCAEERKWCDADLPVACGSFSLDLEEIEEVSSQNAISYSCSWVHWVARDRCEIYPQKGQVWAVYEEWDPDKWSDQPDIVKQCKFNLVEMLGDYCKYTGIECAALVKVDGFKSIFQSQVEGGSPITFRLYPNNLYMLSHNVPAYRFAGGEIDGALQGMIELDQAALQNDTLPEEVISESFGFTIQAEEETPLGPSWSEKDFTTGQVWAVYSRRDSMPREYVLINNVISGNQVRVTVLEPEPIIDNEISWKNEGLPVVCGIFRATETMVHLDFSQLSHSITCQKSTTSPLYKIYPVKGEVWAVYQNWNKRWKQVEFGSYKCWVVEILSDFSDGGETKVARLKEVKGCLTFFQRQKGEDGFDLTRVVSKDDMTWFSHQIPAFRVPGIGRHGIPENCWHLEPVALPPNQGR